MVAFASHCHTKTPYAQICCFSMAMISVTAINQPIYNYELLCIMLLRNNLLHMVCISIIVQLNAKHVKAPHASGSICRHLHALLCIGDYIHIACNKDASHVITYWENLWMSGTASCPETINKGCWFHRLHCLQSLEDCLQGAISI